MALCHSGAVASLSLLIRARLVEKQQSHQDAAAAIGVTQGTFTKWANDEVKPGTRNIDAVARWLGVPVDAVLEATRLSVPTSDDRLDVMASDLATLRELVEEWNTDRRAVGEELRKLMRDLRDTLTAMSEPPGQPRSRSRASPR
jgi:transcriptional regulator with XRE-family HTH domain